MPYTLKHHLHPDFLEVEMDIEVAPGAELEEALGRWSQIADLCEHHDRNRILGKMNFNTTLSLQNTFQLVTAAPKIGWRKEFKLAILLKDDESYVGMKFAETAMVNLGYGLKLFQQRRRAVRWLLSDESK